MNRALGEPWRAHVMSKIHLAKKQGRNKPKHKKEKPEIFPVFGRFGLFFPVLLPFMIVLANVRTRYLKISALRVN